MYPSKSQYTQDCWQFSAPGGGGVGHGGLTWANVCPTNKAKTAKRGSNFFFMKNPELVRLNGKQQAMERCFGSQFRFLTR
jgi:hypothetical protein